MSDRLPSMLQCGEPVMPLYFVNLFFQVNVCMFAVWLYKVSLLIGGTLGGTLALGPLGTVLGGGVGECA